MSTRIAAQVVGPHELPGKAVFPESTGGRPRLDSPSPLWPSWRGGEAMKLAAAGLMAFEVVEQHLQSAEWVPLDDLEGHQAGCGQLHGFTTSPGWPQRRR